MLTSYRVSEDHGSGEVNGVRVTAVRTEVGCGDCTYFADCAKGKYGTKFVAAFCTPSENVEFNENTSWQLLR